MVRKSAEDPGYYSDADIDGIVEASPNGLPDGLVDWWGPAPEGDGLEEVPLNRRTALRGKLEEAAPWYEVVPHSWTVWQRD